MAAADSIQGPDARPRIFRFGLFEVDRRSGELRKAGVRVKLGDQPFRILLMLLDRAGEVVTREELIAELWPDDTFVEFDLGINAAMQKLRRALEDSPRNPRFIETLPRRGYRLITPVQALEAPGSEADWFARPSEPSEDTGRAGKGRLLRPRLLDDGHPKRVPGTQREHRL